MTPAPEVDEFELRTLLQRRAAIERQCFLRPPEDWAEFNVMRGRWLEVNDRVTLIENEIRRMNAEEESK